jgi:hypothetical protein
VITHSCAKVIDSDNRRPCGGPFVLTEGAHRGVCDACTDECPVSLTGATRPRFPLGGLGGAGARNHRCCIKISSRPMLRPGVRRPVPPVVDSSRYMKRTRMATDVLSYFHAPPVCEGPNEELVRAAVAAKKEWQHFEPPHKGGRRALDVKFRRWNGVMIKFYRGPAGAAPVRRDTEVMRRLQEAGVENVPR